MSKRRAERQLTDRDDPDADELGEDTGEPWQRATAEQMAGRKIVHAKRRNQAEPPPMQIPQVDLPETSSTAPLPTFSFTASLTSSSSTTASTPTFSFVTDSSKKEDLNKVPTFSFPPVSLPTFSFAPIANLSDKKDKDGEGKLNEKEDKSPSPNKEESQEKKPEVSGTPEKKSFSWPTFPTTFNPITSVDGVPGATAQSPWPSHDFGKIFAGTSASSTPTTFKFDPNTALLTSPPFNFAAFVQDALSKKDNEEESGSGEGEGDATGVAEKQGVFGKDVKEPVGTSEEVPPVPPNAPPPTLEKKPVVTGEEGETTVFSVRGKLYVFEPASEGKAATWRERGIGTLKINTSEEGKKARILMRAETTLKVLLNAAILPTIKVTKPADKQICFGAINAEVEPGQSPRLLQYLVRLANAEDQLALEKALNERRDALPKPEEKATTEEKSSTENVVAKENPKTAENPVAQEKPQTEEKPDEKKAE